MSHAHCCKNKSNSVITQSLDELDFERGIWSAACDGEKDRVEHFLNKGANPDVRDAAGYTALHYAALKGNVEICRMLLNYGADINAVTRAGKATALHRAATNGKKPAVEFLIEKGASITMQDADGRTALHRAVINGHSEIGKMLTEIHSNLLSIKDYKNKLPDDYYNK